MSHQVPLYAVFDRGLAPDNNSFKPPLSKAKKKLPPPYKHHAPINKLKQREEQEQRLRELKHHRDAQEAQHLKNRRQCHILNNSKKDYSGVKSTSSYKSMIAKQFGASTFEMSTGLTPPLTLNESEALEQKQRHDFEARRRGEIVETKKYAKEPTRTAYFYNSKGQLVPRHQHDILCNPKKDYSGIRDTSSYRAMYLNVDDMSKPFRGFGEFEKNQAVVAEITAKLESTAGQ
jgi:hypothetical protein